MESLASRKTGIELPKWTPGDRLRKAREHAGVTAEEMAVEIGRTARTVRNYELDATPAPLLVVRQYALRCGVPVEWLRDEMVEA